MRILVIEDEKKAAALLRAGLSEARFIVDVAEDGEEGSLRALNMAYELIVRDAVLPRLEGGSLLAAVRRRGRDLPVLCCAGAPSASPGCCSSPICSPAGRAAGGDARAARSAYAAAATGAQRVAAAPGVEGQRCRGAGGDPPPLRRAQGGRAAAQRWYG